LAPRQHNSFVPFFHTVPSEDRQLSFAGEAATAAGAGAAAAGAAMRAVGAAAGAAGLAAPSQRESAVAGVQFASRQHNSFVPFFHTVPSEDRQLSLFWPTAAMGRANAAEAKSIATVLSFFMGLL
jgi:hypothetical protein